MTIEEAINETFKLFPEAIVMVTYNEEPKAIMFKEEWKKGQFDHLKKLNDEYDIADFFEVGEMPIIGTAVKLPLKKKEVQHDD